MMILAPSIQDTLEILQSTHETQLTCSSKATISGSTNLQKKSNSLYNLILASATLECYQPQASVVAFVVYVSWASVFQGQAASTLALSFWCLLKFSLPQASSRLTSIRSCFLIEKYTVIYHIPRLKFYVSQILKVLARATAVKSWSNFMDCVDA